VRYLLDTNVVSEMRKRIHEPRVERWIDNVPEDDLAISVLTLGELAKGVAMAERRHPRAAVDLARWVGTVRDAFAGRTLGIDGEIAEAWGKFSMGRSRPVVDGLLAATAIVHGLTLVTRNIRDVADTGARVVSPWES
jgi:hypothetical protein